MARPSRYEGDAIRGFKEGKRNAPVIMRKRPGSRFSFPLYLLFIFAACLVLGYTLNPIGA